MQKQTIKYAAPEIDGWELNFARLLCDSQLEDIVADDTDGIDF